MATEPNTPGGNPSDPRPAPNRAKNATEPTKPPAAPPPSKPLQIFLLVALLITGGAYVVNEWTELTTEEVLAPHPNKLRRLVKAQGQFLAETDLARQAEATKKYSDAIIHYRRALQGQDNAEGHLNLGNALLKQGNPEMAVSQFKEAIRLDPGMAAVYIAWGEALLHQGKREEAVQVYQDALQYNPKFAEVHYHLALALQQQEQTLQAASRAAEKANQTQPAAKDAEAALLYASDAAKHYATAEKLGLNIPEFWSSYGALLNAQGKFSEAEACLEKAVAQQARLGEAQFQLALAQDRQGKYADAIAHYEATLTIIPDDPATLNNLALLYAIATNKEVRSSKMAILLATRACDATNNENARYMDTLARAYATDGDFFQAINWEEKAVHRAALSVDHDLLRELQPHLTLFGQHRSE